VAAHLAQLGLSAGIISAVGGDALGDEILQVAKDKGVDTEFVSRAGKGLPTGTVVATLDENSNATYELVKPAAWDEIAAPAGALEAVAGARGFVYGSLAGRSPHNLEQVEKLLAVSGPLKFFDVNLRPPYADPARVIALGKYADVIKLNDDEAGQMANWLRTGDMSMGETETIESLAKACGELAAATETERVCVTRGSKGAALWERGELICAAAPHVTVRDTVGAGDAFMAGLVAGLTKGASTLKTLEGACRLGAYVASHFGATPLIPRELVAELGY
jgi:fructokinase